MDLRRFLIKSKADLIALQVRQKYILYFVDHPKKASYIDPT